MTRSFLAAFLLAILAVSSSARAQPFAYVPDSMSGVISVIDVNTGTVTATIGTVLNSARQVVVNPAGTRVYIGRSFSSYLVIETSGNTFTSVGTLNTPGFGAPTGMAINETGTRLYVSTNDPGGAKLVVLDAHTGALLGSTTVGDNPGPIAYSKLHKKVFVTHVQPSAGSVDVVDVLTDTPVTLSGTGYPILVGDALEAAAVPHPSGDRIYVASSTAGEVNIIDAFTDTIVNTVAIPGARDIATNPITGQVYVTSLTGTDIHEFDEDGNGATTFGPVVDNGAGIRETLGISVSPDGSTLLLVSGAANAVMKYAIPNAPPTSTGAAIALGNFPEARGMFIGPATILYTPNAPKNVTAALNGIQGQAVVSFDPPDPTPGNDPVVGTYTYTVTSTNDGVSATGSSSPITVTGLDNGVVHAFTVTATSANGEGARSAESNQVTPLSTVPDPPTGVSAVASAGGATISFTPPVNDGGSTITTYHAVSSPGGLNFFASSSPITAYSLTNGVSYTFTVSAFNGNGEGAPSSPSNAVTPTDVPQPPTVTGLTAGNQEVSVAFLPPSDDGGLPITSYTATSSPGGFTASGPSSPIVVPGLTNLTPYTFTVTATNSAGPSAASNPSGSATPFQPPAAPTNLVASVVLGGDIRVDCTDPSSAGDAPGGITSYFLAASSGGISSSKPTGCPFFVAGPALTPGTAYTFTIRAGTALGSGPASAPSNAVVAVGKPGAPVGVTATANGPTAALVSFAPPASDGFSPITHYTVRSDPPTAALITAGSPIAMGPLAPGTTYTFTVSASNIAGEGPQSAPSNALTASMNPPTGVTALAGDGRATVTFDVPIGAPPSPVTSYIATSSPGGFTASSATARPLVVTGLANGTAYTFTVTANHADGSSETSAASNSVTPARLPRRSSPWAYVASNNDDLVAVIDTATDRVINAIALDPGSQPLGVAANAAGTRVYVTVVGGVSVIDTATQSVIATIPVPDDPFLIAVDPSGSRVYTTTSTAATVSAIDTATQAVTAIPVPGLPLAIEVDPGGAVAYASIPPGQQIVRIDTATNAVVTTSPVLPIAPAGLAASSGTLYAAGFGDGQAATLTASTLAVQSVTALPAGYLSLGIAVDAANEGVYFTRTIPAGFTPSEVQKLGGGSVTVGVNASGIAVTPTGGKVYVANTSDGTVSVIDSASMTVIATIPVGRFPVSVGRFIANPVPQRLLTVTKAGTGSGTVGAVAPAGDIDCGTTCSNSFDDGASVTLSATAAAGSTFTGWSGACTGTAQCTVTMDAAKTVTATFTFIDPPRLGNISTRGQVLTGNDVMIAGFVIGGSANKDVAIVATGPSLAPFGIANPLANPALTLVRSSDQAVLATIDDWQSAPNAAQLQAAGFSPADPLEAALLVNLPPGAYTAIVQGAGGGTGVAVAAVYEVGGPEIPLVNISTRGLVGTGNDVMIGGFVIQGDGPQQVAIVATGPSLAPFGISNPLANPTLTLVRSSDQAILASNDDWAEGSNAAQLQAAGFAPSDALEAAILTTLPPGAYTAIVQGVGGGTGVSVIGVYRVP